MVETKSQVVELSTLVDMVVEKVAMSEQEMDKAETNGRSEAKALGPIDDHFICSICMTLVNDPVKCGDNCESLFCRACIKKWSAKETSCPKKCGQAGQAFKEGKLVKYERNTLNNIQFTCEKCGSTYSYEKKCCPCRAFDCPAGCGVKLSSVSELKSHLVEKCA